MDGIANVARQQQSQIDSSAAQSKAAQQSQQAKDNANVVKQMQESNNVNNQKINSEKQVKELVDQLNQAMAPMNTDIKFGVDSQDVFYVSVIEADSQKLIRRFPAEKAAEFLPKMQEVTGMLFDSKG